MLRVARKCGIRLIRSVIEVRFGLGVWFPSVSPRIFNRHRFESAKCGGIYRSAGYLRLLHDFVMRYRDEATLENLTTEQCEMIIVAAGIILAMMTSSISGY